MNRKATFKSKMLAVAAITAMPAVVKADEVWYSGAVGHRSPYVQYSPVRHTATRVIEYGNPPIYRSCYTPQSRTTVTYVEPEVPTCVYPTQPTVTHVVRTTPVYVARRVSCGPMYPVHAHRPVVAHRHRPLYRPALYPSHHGSRGWGFDVGYHSGRGGHRGGGFGFHFDR